MQELRSTEVKWFMWGCTVGNEGGNEGQVSPIQSCHAWSVHLREWWASGLSPGQLQAEELNELCVRWAVLRHFGGQTTKHPNLGAYFVAQLGPLQSCNQGVRQDWNPIRVEGFTAKLMWSLEKFSCLQAAWMRVSVSRWQSREHSQVLTTWPSPWTAHNIVVCFLKGRRTRVLARQVLKSYVT